MKTFTAAVFVTLYVTVITAITEANNRVAEECQTPKKEKGECIPITKCPPLQEMLRNLSAAKDSLEFLRKAHCGFEDNTPKVCCAKGQRNKKSAVTVKRRNLLPGENRCGVYIDDGLFSEAADFNQYPWTALLRYTTKDGLKQFYCSGSLINERYVLTAAHCIQGKNLPGDAKLVSVRLGEYNVETNPDCEYYIEDLYDCAEPFLDVPIEKTIVHEDYIASDPNQYHDIALIRLKSKVSYDYAVSPVCLPSTYQEKNFTGVNLVTAGWGILANQIKYPSKKIYLARGKESSECEELFQVNLTKNQFCVERRSRQKSCSDDSGGILLEFHPELANHYAVGVMSFGSCNSSIFPKVYTRVDRYFDWIVSKLMP